MSTILNYKIIKAELALGYVEVDLYLPDGSVDKLTVPTISVATSDNDTETMLAVAIGEVVKARYAVLNPPPVPEPAALGALVGRTLQVAV